jgi:hypothetical protein
VVGLGVIAENKESVLGVSLAVVVAVGLLAGSFRLCKPLREIFQSVSGLAVSAEQWEVLLQRTAVIRLSEVLPHPVEKLIQLKRTAVMELLLVRQAEAGVE